ncbi:phage endolysin [Pseudanabaena sp. lw0831]|uniref:glycoside hydrolase family 19 protein n=1 Tax=Pseudanabaena sp. lw0831 TaxID=1357935 RepID=UPI0019151270|nr:glycoside hydrolase family 19 protein [Pseudanabaena sp. lw0831]GBO52772.1 phage endolysin [Pseudanabaena sp. lw0831]
MKQVEIWRSQAAATLAFLVPKIVGDTINEKDGLVDDLMRVLNNLPARPEERQPYAGILPAADLPTWRRRAALTLQASVPKIPDVEGSVFDGAIDDLIRFLRNLPARPTGRSPYSGLFPAADLATWRKQAAQTLVALIGKIVDPKYNSADGRIDDLIRVISGLTLRPISRKPYEGLYQAPNLTEYRKLAARRLDQLITALRDDFNAKDVLVDSTIRILNNLPPRQLDQEPYEGLYPRAVEVITFGFITQEQLSAIAPYSQRDRLEKLLPHLNTTMQRYAITTPLRKAHFLAQVGHESDGFNTNEEYASGADYEGRRDLGNTQAGDGVRFKGRGLIQVTGRANYADCGRALAVDLINNPRRLGDFDLACLSAGWYWDTRKLNNHADRDDILTITKIINGGTNGLADRQSYLARAKRVFGI